MTVLMIVARWFNIAFVNVHAPTKEKEEVEKKEFFSLLNNVLNNIPANCIQIILGGFNAKIGKENYFRPIISIHSLHELSTDNGYRLVAPATEKDLRIKRTMFKHKNINKSKWRYPNGLYVNQIYHVLVNSRFTSTVIDVKSARGAECDTDHILVVGKLKVTLKKTRSSKKIGPKRCFYV